MTKESIPFYQRLNEARIPFSQRPSCSIDEACQATGLRRSMLYEMMRRGEVQFAKVGSRRLILIPSLLKLLSPSEADVEAA